MKLLTTELGMFAMFIAVIVNGAWIVDGGKTPYFTTLKHMVLPCIPILIIALLVNHGLSYIFF